MPATRPPCLRIAHRQGGTNPVGVVVARFGQQDVAGCEVFDAVDCGDRTLSDPVERGRCYKVRVSDNGYEPSAGTLTLTCHADCPPGEIVFVDPPASVVDAHIRTRGTMPRGCWG